MTYCCHCGCEMFRYSEVCPSCGKRVVKADLGMGWKLLASLPIIAALIFGAYVYYNYEAWTEDIYTAGYTEGYERGEVYGKSAGKKVGFEQIKDAYFEGYADGVSEALPRTGNTFKDADKYLDVLMNREKRWNEYRYNTAKTKLNADEP